ncbi:MAG: beta-ketoacyl-ACP synthase II [Candidatus Limiplasma sp.]|nr:beta-ketoacyl-ACP synthase II [Candidatus Limiplasma sp.]
MRRVLVTGLGVISPVGNSVPDFWNALVSGVCGIGPITRFDTSALKAKVAAQVKDFDPQEHGMDVPTARRLDLFAQYAMAAALQAMEDSGFENADPQRFGVYVGSGIGGMHTFSAECEKLLTRGPDRVSPFFIPMMIGNMAAGNIAIRFNAQGPCLPVVTACATSTHAIGEAYRAIRHGYADAILAGGCEAAIEPLAVAGFTSCKALSLEQDPQAACVPFDLRRQGFVMGEGAGVLLLEEAEQAMARHAPIYGEVVGYGNTCDANHITAPHPEGLGAAQALKLALEEAGGLGPQDRLYLNAHGTGTPLNDKVETQAIKLALGEEAARKILMSSTKSATGHMLGAAGAVECIASLMAVKTGVVPPTLHLDQPDPDCDLDYVPHHSRQWRPTMALSLSLGFGGHNSAVAVRKVP